MAEGIKYPQHLVFGLDIGTRSIVGTVGYKEKNQFIAVAQYVKEHDTRAMMDGQIHDIPKVGDTIRFVKEKLEEVIERPLTEVCIAAAGRVLMTVNTKVEYEFPQETIITQEEISSLDLLGVEQAHGEIVQRNDLDTKFYCVGYTVINYYLNGYFIKNLEGHKGSRISAEMISTFLPEEVVNGLYSAVKAADLEVANLTLEPIAAINIAIPEKFRMLNIALIDIGAGTSDISITKDGSIIAYGMIPRAGDALTEIVAQHLLTDFNTADAVKIQASEEESVSYEDIMGLEQTITSGELEELVKPVVEDLAEKITEKILELNGNKPVNAVFIVGGGGKFKGFTGEIAKRLGLAKERVALRGEAVLEDVIFLQEGVKKDPLLVTPIGICLNFYEQNNNFIFVRFNGERIKLYDNNRLAVVDAAMQAGFSNEDLFPKRGKSLNFKINGVPRMIRGEAGEAALVTLNGEPVGISSLIKQNDNIIITHSTAGEDARHLISQLPEYNGTLTVFVNGQKIICPKYVQVGERLESGYYSIKDQDEIRMLDYYTVEQLLGFMDITLEKDMEVFVNHMPAARNEKVYENFHLTVFIHHEEPVSEEPEPEESEPLKQSEEQNKKTAISEEEKTITIIANREKVILSGKKDYVFVDVFDKINFDLRESKGREIITILNGRKAIFMESLNEGDIIEIYWKG